MSRRTAVEVKIVEFFRDADLQVAASILEVCRATIKGRMETHTAPSPAKVKRKRTPRKALGADPLAAPANG